jgi:NADPH-dependent ferric siderophore reductase
LELGIDFVLHPDAEGPGATWVQNAKLGDVIVVTGPGGPYKIDEGAEWFLIAGDHAALPAICTVLEALPPAAYARVYVEIADEAEEIGVESPAQIDLTWLYGGGDASLTGRLLEKTIQNAELPEGNGRVFVACEASVMRDIRNHLLYQRGFSSGAIHTHGYWKYGEANHPDHDLGQNV